MAKKFLILIVILIIVPFSKVNAQQLNGLTVSPALVATAQHSGETKTYTLKIYSDTDRTVNLSIKLLSKDSNLTQPVLFDDVPSELLNWFFNLQRQMYLKSNEENTLNVVINIPKEYMGNYNFALVFEESSPQVVDSNNTAEVTSQVAIPFILNIINDDSEFYEALNISKYKINPELSFDGKSSFNISLLNSGDSYLIPRGILSIQPEKVIGNFQEQDVSINSEKRILLSSGSLDLNFDKNFEQNSIGQYKATLTVVYGLQNKVLTKDIYFWVIPEWVFILGIIIISLVIVFVFRKIYLNKKSK